MKLYRRHSNECEQKADRLANCGCAIWAQWQDRPGHQTKKATGTTDWAKAEKLAKAGKFGQRLTSLDVEPDREVDMLLADAIAEYVAHKRDVGNAGETVDLARRLLEKLRIFASVDRHVERLRHVTPTLLSDFRKTWQLRRDPKTGAPATYAWNTWSSAISNFFVWCHRRGLIAADPSAAGLPRMKVKTKQTEPYSEADVQAMLAAIPGMKMPERMKKRARAIILLGRHSGLAAMDIGMLRRDQIVDGCLETKRQKTSVAVAVPLPSIVIEALEAVENPANPECFFYSGACTPKSLSVMVSELVTRVEQAAGVKRTSKQSVHRLRDAYAIGLITSGVPIEDVSKALGHSSTKITEQHYSPWIETRKKSLIASLKASWAKQGISA